MTDFVGIPIMIRSRRRKSLGVLTGIKGFMYDPNLSFRDLSGGIQKELIDSRQFVETDAYDECFVLVRRFGTTGDWVVVPHDVLITAWHETWTSSNRVAVPLGGSVEELLGREVWDPNGFCPDGEWSVIEDGASF